jgi:hypothetical protein
MTNPFSKNSKITNDIADILAKHKQEKLNNIPDTIKSAAKDAGSELKNTRNASLETKNSIYNKHFKSAIDSGKISSDSRQNFERLADQEFNTPSE